VFSAGIFKQSMGRKEPSRNRVVVPARQPTYAGGIDSLKSILGLHKSFKIGAQKTDTYSTLLTVVADPDLDHFAESGSSIFLHVPYCKYELFPEV
jgi:hypothetical protein